jgi:hypothetical protein
MSIAHDDTVAHLPRLAVVCPLPDLLILVSCYTVLADTLSLALADPRLLLVFLPACLLAGWLILCFWQHLLIV